MGKFSEQITIDASRDNVWKTLADIGNIYEWNPGVIESHTTSKGEIGNGSSRRCDLGGKNYLLEDVVEWEPGRVLTMRIMETNMPFKSADIRFTLEEKGKQTIVTITPDYKLKFGLLGTLLDVISVKRMYRKGMIKLLQGLKQHVEKEVIN